MTYHHIFGAETPKIEIAVQNMKKKKKKLEFSGSSHFINAIYHTKQEKIEGVVRTVQVSQVCLDGMTLNITITLFLKTVTFYNCILMVRAWVWVLTIVELIANCLVSICFEMYICA